MGLPLALKVAKPNDNRLIATFNEKGVDSTLAEAVARMKKAVTHIALDDAYVHQGLAGGLAGLGQSQTHETGPEGGRRTR